MNIHNFQQVVDAIYLKSPLQKKKLEKHFRSRGEDFFNSADEFVNDYMSFLKDQGISFDYAIDAYLKMCSDMMKSQISFQRTDEYPVKCSKEALKNVYSDEAEMKSYMVALALSQFLWSTHFDMYSFFKEKVDEVSKKVESYLEIGPGHGLFLIYALRNFKYCKKFDAVDISPISLNISKSIVNHLVNTANTLSFYQKDMLDLDLNEKYDFITMGEVIEHVNHPDVLLKKLRDLLSSKGMAFVSTCVNCPAIDHVYHFRNVQEIKQLINACNLEIFDEKILPVENLPMPEIIDKKITINYCALIKPMN